MWHPGVLQLTGLSPFWLKAGEAFFCPAVRIYVCWLALRAWWGGMEPAGEDEAPVAPAATVYASHIGSIVETLRDLTEQAEAQLTSARNTETANLNIFKL